MKISVLRAPHLCSFGGPVPSRQAMAYLLFFCHGLCKSFSLATSCFMILIKVRLSVPCSNFCLPFQLIILGGCCILGLYDPGVQLFLEYNDQGSMNPRTEQPGSHQIVRSLKSTTMVVDLASCSVTPLSKIFGRLIISANFGGQPTSHNIFNNCNFHASYYPLILVLVSILWYLTLNSQVLLPQAVLHVTYSTGIEKKPERDACLQKVKPLSQIIKMKRHIKM